MDNSAPICLAPVVILLAALAAWVLADKHGQRQAWRAFAGQHGLTFSTYGWLAAPRLAGVYRRRHLLARADDTLLLTRPRIILTEATISLNCADYFHVSLSKKSIVRQMGEAILKPAIATGDVFLDQVFTVQGEPRAYVRDLVRDPALRPHLVVPHFFDLELNAKQMIWRQHDGVHNIQAFVDRACALAEAVEAYPAAHPIGRA